jgi:polysaccharide biosynthesis transport protein
VDSVLPHDNAGNPDPAPLRPAKSDPAALRFPGRGYTTDSYQGPWRGRPAGPGSQGPDVGALLKALRRRWLTAICLGLVVAGAAAAAAWFGLSPRYTVYSQVRIAASQPSLVFRTDLGRGDFATFQRTQVATIRSRFVLNEALKRDEVKRLPLVAEQPEPLSWLEEELKVDFKEGSEIVSISLSGEDPQQLAVVVNAVTQAYLSEVKSQDSKQASAKASELENLQTDSRNRLKENREKLKKRAEELGTTNSQALTVLQVGKQNNLGEIRRQQSQVQFESMRARGELAVYKARGKSLESLVVPEDVVAGLVAADPRVLEAQARVAKIQDFITSYEVQAGRPTERTLVMAREQLAKAQQVAEQVRTEVRKPLVDRLRQKAVAEYQAGLAPLEDKVVILAEQDKALQAQINELGKETFKVGNSTVELEMLQAEIQEQDKLVNRLTDELNQVQVELRRPFQRVTPYQDAGAQKKDIKRQVMATAAAPAAALLLVCFGVGYWEYRARRIHSADEVVKGVGLRVVGAVPALPHPASLADEALQAVGASSLESIDALRTLLLRDASIELTRLVMVTSAVEGEGKTTLAAHLAGSLARAGRKTLLVDCDLRQPAAHQLFELPLQPGFSEVLLGEVAVDDAIAETPIDGLWMIPAGQWDREVLQALAREGVEKTFERLKEDFDFVILDAHPVLAATDSLLIGQHADAVILSLQRDVSQVPRVFAAGQQLSNLGIRVLGAVVNGMEQADLYSNGYQFAAHATR